MKETSRKLIIIAVVCFLIAGACAPAPTPTATPLPPIPLSGAQAAATVPPPTATPVPLTATPIPPTATVPPPTATVPLPTATNPPPAATVPPPTATASHTAVALIPPGRGNPAMAYDAQANVVILYGGTVDIPAPLSDTWAYDPVAALWSPMHPAQAPVGLGHMVYDDHAGRLILYVFSNKDTTGSYLFQYGPLGETWAYDFKTDTWTNRQAANTPLGLAFARLAYDSESDRVILFGGVDYAKGGLHTVPMSDETWAYDYDSNAWTKMNPKVRPPARADHAMTYDAAADRVILFGGATAWVEDVGEAGPLNDTWAYDYNADAWTELKPAAAPAARTDASLVYDPGAQRDILVGGDPWAKDQPCYHDTWAFDFKSNTWKDLSPASTPPALCYQGTALIPTTKQILAFVGGALYGGYTYTHWLYSLSDNTWRSVYVLP